MTLLIVCGRYVLPGALTIGVVVYFIANMQANTADWKSAGIALAVAVFFGFFASSSFVNVWISKKEESENLSKKEELGAAIVFACSWPDICREVFILGLIAFVIASLVI
jgi:hypothetical protein